jgi:hypothetical protein
MRGTTGKPFAKSLRGLSICAKEAAGPPQHGGNQISGVNRQRVVVRADQCAAPRKPLIGLDARDISFKELDEYLTGIVAVHAVLRLLPIGGPRGSQPSRCVKARAFRRAHRNGKEQSARLRLCASDFLEGGDDADGDLFGRSRRRVGMEDVMSESPQFIGLLGQREIVLIQTILRENDATEEEMKKLFEEERMRKRLTAALQEVRAEILVQHGETVHE